MRAFKSKIFGESVKMTTKEINIEELVEDYSFAVQFLAKKGICCIACGEPIWGTLEEACEEKGFSAEVVEELTKLKNNKIR